MQPVVHPSHTTNVNHTNIQEEHFFPHTESVVNEVTHQNLGPVPGPLPYPGAVAGAMTGPGMGPYPGPGMGPMGSRTWDQWDQMGPGGYPGSVAGAMTGPGMGPKGKRFF